MVKPRHDEFVAAVPVRRANRRISVKPIKTY